MPRDELLKECCVYIRRIGVLENWFTYLFTVGRFSDEVAMRYRLNTERPGYIPSIREAREMDAGDLNHYSNVLSLWVRRLENVRDLCFTKKWLPGMFKFQIFTVLDKLEAGVLTNWETPFTRGIGRELKHVFGEEPDAIPVIGTSKLGNAE